MKVKNVNFFEHFYFYVSKNGGGFMFYLVVFSVRTHTLQFNALMLKNNVRCVVVSTPKRVSSVCGISVKIPESALGLARAYAKNYSSFIGIYRA